MSEADPGGIGAGASAPYPGLRPFRPDEWAIFCGRERTTLDVIARLGERNLVFVHGGSGCGKSSLVCAGVLPAIDRDHRLAGRRFDHAIMRPSQGPLTALDRLLTGVLGEIDGGWAQALIFPDSVVERIEAACVAAGIDTFCLVVDQFEEAFRWARECGPEDVQVLTDVLGHVAASTAGRRFFVLTTMRSDYIGDCAQFAGLSTVINECQFFLPNLDARGLLRSIVDPARQFGGSVDEALANRLRFSAAGERDPLPTLQHLLMRMAERARAGGTPWTIDCTDLEAAGTGGVALSRHADELFAAASGGEPDVESDMAWLFRALVDRDVGGRGIRRPCRAGELAAVSGLSPERLDRVLDVFSAERANLLMVSDPGEGRDARRVDISHEALIRNWTRMTSADGKAGWLARELDDGLLWRALAVSARTATATLDGATLIERETWFAPFSAHPERARRYLIRPEGKALVIDEPEWQAVVGLLGRSRAALDAEARRVETERAAQSKRTRNKRAFAALATLAVVIAIFVAALSYQSARKQDQDTVAVTKSINAAVNERKKEQPAGTIGTDTVSDDSLKVLAPVLANVATAGSAIGFMWIGSDSRSYLTVPGGDRVRPSTVQPGKVYQTTYNIVLRKGPPDSNGRTQPAINVVARGSLIVAKSPPTPAQATSGTQYWLEIKEILPPATAPPKDSPKAEAKPVALRVYPHFAVDNPKAVDVLTSGLTARGYTVMGTQVLPQAKGVREVRFCYAADSAAAEKLVDALYDIFPTRAIIRATLLKSGCGKTRRGTLEVWIGNP